MLRSMMTGVVVCVCSSAATGQMISTSFDAGAEGWTLQTRNQSASFITGNFELDVFSSGGNPGGYISRVDPNNSFSYFRASSAYRGDLSAFSGGRLSFSILTNIDNTREGRNVIFESDSTQISARAAAPSINAWTSSSIDLSEGVWFVGAAGEGTLATQAEIDAVLASVTDLLIGSEYGSMVGQEIVGLDSVRLIPTPASASLLGLAGAVVLRRRR